MRLVLLGFPHTRFDDVAFSHCAFTAKAVRLVEMLRGELGAHVAVMWSGDQPVNGCDDYVPLLSDEEQRRFFGPDLPANILYLDWNPETAPWRIVNHRAAAWLHAFTEPDDAVLVMSGSNHNGLMTEFPHLIWLEPCVGYTGISMLSAGKVFESHAWRHHLYGKYGINDGNPLDAVIPNFYRPDDFHTGVDKGYLLFIGRMIQRKGIEDVIQIARYTGRPLVIAGQGAHLEADGSKLVCDDGTVVDCSEITIAYQGVVGPEARANLYANAAATLVPTRYIEPWGGVFAEAMLSGVWPVTTNWGGFPEWVPPQCRFNRIEEAADCVDWAVEHRGSYEGTSLRDVAVTSFGLKTCADAYDRWLHRIAAARGE